MTAKDATDRMCDSCVWSTRSGGCASWDCHFIKQQTAVDALMNQKKWVDPGRELPSHCSYVLVCTETKKGKKAIKTGYYDESLGWVCGMNNNVIAWQELPDPPESEADYE